MEERINYMLTYHETTLKRKENLVKPYHDKRNKLEDLTISEYTSMLVLEAEIQQEREFIEDLKYIKEGK